MKRVLNLLALVLAVFLGNTAAFGQSGGDFELGWSVLSGGGGTSAGGAPGNHFELSGTIGQATAGEMDGGEFFIAGGFWAGLNSGPLRPPCPADFNADGTVDVLDLLLLLSSWGVCDAPCATDINSDGAVDVLDLLVLLAAWGPCP